MKKLRLDLGELKVESFDPAALGGPGAGTVHGYYTAEVDGCVPSEYPPECESAGDTYCGAVCGDTAAWSPTCQQNQTCYSCPGTCGFTCFGTCGNTCGEYTCECPSWTPSYCETCRVEIC